MKNRNCKYSLLIIGVALMGFSSCKKDEVEPTPSNPTTGGTDPAIVLDCNYFNQDRVLVDNPEAPVDYIITCKMQVAGDIIIEPGVVIEFEQNAGINIDDFNVPKASLSAVGTAGKPVVFRGVVKDAGHWGAVRYSSNSSLNELTHVYIEDAGGTSMGGNGETAGVIMYADSKLKMTNTSITNSETYGLNAQYGNTELTLNNNVFKNNNIPAYVSTVCIEDLNATNSFTGNAEDYVRVRNRTIDDDKTWKKIDVKYKTDGDIDIKGFLTIEPGVVIEMAQASKIKVSEVPGGTDGGLKAVGTAADPIIFTGISKVNKAWQGIFIQSDFPENEIAHAEIHYSGFDEPAANVYLWYERVLNIHDVSFHNIAGCAISYKLHAGQAENPNLTIGPNVSVSGGGCVGGEW